jgi:hypothetical protein
VRVAMALTQLALAVTTIHAISPRVMWGFIRGMGGGARDIMGAGFMGREVFGAFD